MKEYAISISIVVAGILISTAINDSSQKITKVLSAEGKIAGCVSVYAKNFIDSEQIENAKKGKPVDAEKFLQEQRDRYAYYNSQCIRSLIVSL